MKRRTCLTTALGLGAGFALFLAFFVGNLVGNLLPDSTYKDGVLMAAGFCTYPILNIIEVQSKRRLGQLVEKWMTRQVGSVPDKDGPEA